MGVTRNTQRKRKQYNMLHNMFYNSNVAGKMLCYGSNGKGRVWVEARVFQGTILLRCTQCGELSDGTRFIFGYGAMDNQNGGRVSCKCSSCRSRGSISKRVMNDVDSCIRNRAKLFRSDIAKALQQQLTVLHKIYANDRALYRQYGERVNAVYELGRLPSDKLKDAFEFRRLRLVEEQEMEKVIKEFALDREYPDVQDLVASERALKRCKE